MMRNRLSINIPLLFFLVGLGYYFDVPDRLGLINIYKTLPPITPGFVNIDPVPEIASPYDGCETCSMPARQIAWSLDNQTSEWVSDTYIVHRGNVWIWIANDAYGIQVGKDASVTANGLRLVTDTRREIPNY